VRGSCSYRDTLGGKRFGINRLHWQGLLACEGKIQLSAHEDTWKAGPDITFREHEGRGYWKGDTWTTW
jgi:hypothetical protein